MDTFEENLGLLNRKREGEEDRKAMLSSKLPKQL